MSGQGVSPGANSHLVNDEKLSPLGLTEAEQAVIELIEMWLDAMADAAIEGTEEAERLLAKLREKADEYDCGPTPKDQELGIVFDALVEMMEALWGGEDEEGESRGDE